MTESVRDLLRAFEALSPVEQQQMAAEILRRWAAAEILKRWIPDEDIKDEPLDELAAEVFRGYDAEESRSAAITVRNEAPHESGIRMG